MITRLNALVWLQTLYACDFSKMEPQTVEGLPDIPLNEIAIKGEGGFGGKWGQMGDFRLFGLSV